MREHVLAAGALGLVALTLGGTTSGQVQTVPGPGTGVVTVQGEVDVRRLPPIDVGQRGEWRVSLASPADTRVVNVPAVTLARPWFVRAGGRYTITWDARETEIVTIAQVGDSAWVRATFNGRDRWLNLSLARSVEETP